MNARSMVRAIALLACLMFPSLGRADSGPSFSKYTIVLSGEAGFNYFGPRLPTTGFLQTWNFAARLSLLPFAPVHTAFLGHLLDGSFEAGVEPVYVRFASLRQNFGGAGINLRYYLLGLRFGPFVPWINWMGALGGTDLRIAALNGPFMFDMQAGAGFAWLSDENYLLYLGFQYTHFSNGGVEAGNNSLNSAAGAVAGVSFFIPH